VPQADQVQPERLDEGRLAHAGNAGNAQPEGAPGARQQRVEQRVGAGAVVGPGRLEQRDRLGHRAPLHRRLRAGDAGSQGLLGGRQVGEVVGHRRRRVIARCDR